MYKLFFVSLWLDAIPIVVYVMLTHIANCFLRKHFLQVELLHYLVIFLRWQSGSLGTNFF